jgi:mannose-6-phosphate isomerase-like protein (cupin superfamily)
MSLETTMYVCLASTRVGRTMSGSMPCDSIVPAVTRARAGPDAIAPDGSEIRLLVDEHHGISRASACEVTLPAGATSKPVCHRTVEEIWYILDGHGEVWRAAPGSDVAQSRPVAVERGDTLTIPCQWRFQFRASAGGPLRFLCFSAPPWPGFDEAEPASEGGYWPSTL